MRLIDADEFESYLINRYSGNDTGDEIIEDLYNQPTVDAVKRKRGEWEEITDATMDCCYRCSKCGFIRDAYFLEIDNFCPNCGAEMRKGEEE